MKLKNNRRKTGWLFFDFQKEIPLEPFNEIHCMNIHYGRKLIYGGKNIEFEMLKPHAEAIPVEDIVTIRSWK